MNYVTERAKKVPVAYDVDVAVAGAGISGLFAAIAAARGGAKVVLVDRMGAPGGNMGPGMFVGYTLEKSRGSYLHQGQWPGVLGEFMDRFERALDGMPRVYGPITHAVSQVAFEMMQEQGAELLLSAYAADPILTGRRVRGLFVETKSGRLAIKAKVVVDGTGDADLAARAGAPVLRGAPVAAIDAPNVQPHYKLADHKSQNDTNIFVTLADADFMVYNSFRNQAKALSEEEKAWARRCLGEPPGWKDAMIPILKRGWESGEFKVKRELRPNFYVAFSDWFCHIGPGLVGARPTLGGEFDTGDARDVTQMESAIRRIAYDGVCFFRRHVPGFAHAYVLASSAFLGARGGPCIDAEYVLTPAETFAGVRLPDVLYVSYVEVHRGADKKGHDMPYRMLLPKKVDGLLVTGRGAGFLRRGHDPSTRERSNMMALGAATGLAAALAANQDVAPRRLDVRTLQRGLLAEGFYLGDAARLAELGLSKKRRPR